MFTLTCFKAVILEIDVQGSMPRSFLIRVGIEPRANAIRLH